MMGVCQSFQRQRKICILAYRERTHGFASQRKLDIFWSACIDCKRDPAVIEPLKRFDICPGSRCKGAGVKKAHTIRGDRGLEGAWGAAGRNQAMDHSACRTALRPTDCQCLCRRSTDRRARRWWRPHGHALPKTPSHAGGAKRRRTLVIRPAPARPLPVVPHRARRRPARPRTIARARKRLRKPHAC